MSGSRRVRLDDLGAWLVKANPRSQEVTDHLAAGLRTITSRCVQRSYRTDLVRPGHRVLLWISGNRRDVPPGIHGHGTVTGACREEAGTLEMPVRLRALSRPVSRAQLLADPVLRQVEVLVQPQGSNPSYVSKAQWAALVAGAADLAQTDPGDGPGPAAPRTTA